MPLQRGRTRGNVVDGGPASGEGYVRADVEDNSKVGGNA